jgi:hypothetical protein
MSVGRIKLVQDSLESGCRLGVCVSGYHWVRAKYTIPPDDYPWCIDAKPTVGRVLTNRPGTFQRRGYDPLAIPDLFRIFASTGTDPDSVLAFANQYGELGPHVEIVGGRRTKARLGVMEVAESYDRWRAEILHLREAIRIWDAFHSGDDGLLRKVVCKWEETEPTVRERVRNHWLRQFRRHGDRGEFVPDDWWIAQFDDNGNLDWYVPHHHYKVIDRNATDRELHKVELTRRQAARSFLADDANEYLLSFSGVQLEERDRLVAEYKIQVEPQYLLGAMWWQLARLVVGEAALRQCKVCGRPMEISTGPHGARTNREFCTDACKLKDHRRKVREAKQMKAEGRTVQQIAKHFDTELATIKHWLIKRK